MNLHGKVALVTGGARRVGRALSEALGAAGASVVINYNNSAGEAEALQRELNERGIIAAAIQADLSTKSGIDALLRQVRAQFGRLDILINNASAFESAPFLDITEEMWDRVLGVNLKAPFFLAQAAAPLLTESGVGNIVNIADLSALQPWPSYAHHSVSKAGLVHLTKVLARALAPAVRVNGITPGTVLPPDDYNGTAGDGTPDRRVVTPHGVPDDVVRALFYLLESNFVTGQIVVVDGGRTLL